MSENQFLGNLLNDNEEIKESKLINTKKEIFGKFRSTSAPPEVEKETFEEEDEENEDKYRNTLNYYSYYQNNRLLNPRLPPPIFNPRTNWQLFHKVI
jgi:hypothetical protein